MNTHSITANIKRNKLYRATFQFSWELSVLLFKLLVIVTVIVFTFFAASFAKSDLRSNDKFQQDDDDSQVLRYDEGGKTSV
jgi:hypothetical protein